ncbi:hypothetical protein [Pedobacter metabolipauper]|uniref:Self-protective colicin-like immunity protein n=1 Tax=Pedobacter metabolipauper TaxID=425513 RepID=A0A4R6SZF3_9SPHI|nr:hypothetical protein [Pedobacter metabolipauper]TDQ12024.1 hypothetical protein ATK78_1154 [Pedobacter metabolipauper]
MYNKNDKRRLYWLIDEYLTGKINDVTFCDEFYDSYDLEIVNESFNEVEKIVFYELSQVASRFSQYESDHELDANAFSTSQEVMQKSIETREKLKGCRQIY